MNKIIVAIDSFKGSIDSAGANAACTAGIADVLPMCRVECVTLADGGEGTVDAVAANMPGGIFQSCPARDPLGRTRMARYYALPDRSTAIIETADCAGLTNLSLKERDPWLASSFGLGATIADAVSRGYRSIIVGLGGSATNDGGTGMLQALGYRLIDSDGHEITWHGGQILGRIKAIDNTHVIKGLDKVRFTALCDVSNPLLDTNGATLVYGAQKGADNKELLDRLEAGMTNYASVIGRDIADTPGAGAAGGIGAAMLAFLGASLKPGIKTILSLAGFETVISGADLIVTGEGKIDRSTFMGKGPYGIMMTAKVHNVPVVALAGSVADDIDSYNLCDIVAITPPDTPLETAMRTDIASQNIRKAIAAYLKDRHLHS